MNFMNPDCIAMNPNFNTQHQGSLNQAIAWFKVNFIELARWTTELSWGRFFLFSLLILIMAGIVEDVLFDSSWFDDLVLLLILVLFGIKALMGGTFRAEARAAAAQEATQREALKRQVSEATMQMMQAQVEPHFLFNTLATVEHLIETDPPRAAAMQRRLIQYLRGVLPQMRGGATTTNLGREADIVGDYLDLLKMRMEERLQIKLNIPEGLRSAAFPPMMLQLLTENAIKHGLECKPEGGTLTVKAEVAHNKLRVTVADDGMGFGVVPSNGTGLGLQSIRDRLNLLYGVQAQLIISQNTPSGVSATIEVPYQLAQDFPTTSART